MPERRVDEPPLSFAGPDGPAIPGPGVLRLPVPLEVADVAGFELDRVAVMGTQDRDARVRTRSRRRRRARGSTVHDEKHRANDPKPAMLHDGAS